MYIQQLSGQAVPVMWLVGLAPHATLMHATAVSIQSPWVSMPCAHRGKCETRGIGSGLKQHPLRGQQIEIEGKVSVNLGLKCINTGYVVSYVADNGKRPYLYTAPTESEIIRGHRGHYHLQGTEPFTSLTNLVAGTNGMIGGAPAARTQGGTPISKRCPKGCTQS